MSAQLRLIRSRYKTMCASFGVRARLQPAFSPGTTEDSPDGTIAPDADAGAENRGKKSVWPFAGPSVASTSPQGLSF